MDITEDSVPIGNGPFLVQNLGTDNVFLGESAVSDTTGYLLKPGEAISFGYLNNKLYGVCSENDTASLRILHGATGIFTSELNE